MFFECDFSCVNSCGPLSKSQPRWATLWSPPTRATSEPSTTRMQYWAHLDWPPWTGTGCSMHDMFIRTLHCTDSLLVIPRKLGACLLAAFCAATTTAFLFHAFACFSFSSCVLPSFPSSFSHPKPVPPACPHVFLTSKFPSL